MKINPQVIKPCRTTSKSPRLNNAKTIKNFKSGKETSLVFDLNILSKMHEVMQGEVSLKESGLAELVKFLNSTNALCPTPGFAIKEVDASYLKTITKSFDMFLSKYCCSYMDHPNGTKNYLESEDNAREFNELSLVERQLNSIAYLGILKIQLICRKSPSLEPYDKFKKYIQFMSLKADMLGAVEAEAAKYVFFDLGEIKDIRFKNFSKSIKDNFKKGGNSHGKLLQKCLNSARDIMYYRLTANISNEIVDGKLQDTWLLTGDEGLLNLSRSIYFNPQKGSSDSKHVSFVRHSEQKKSDYWILCDDLFHSTVAMREAERVEAKKSEFTESDFDALLILISKIESELFIFI